MKLKKILAYVIGGLCAAGLLCGLLILLFKTPMAITSAVVIICLSICFGILTANPICIWPLIGGICMLIFPPEVAGIVIMVLSVAGAVANCLVFRKRKE